MVNPTGVIIKYAGSVYQEKIGAFESLNGQLQQHLNTLEGLKEQIPNFWEGEQTGRYIRKIAEAIVKVRTASADIAELRDIYQGVMDDHTRMGAAADEMIDQVDKAIDQTIDVAGTAAKFVI